MLVDNLVRKCATHWHTDYLPDACRDATNRMILYDIHPQWDSDICHSFLEPVLVKGYDGVVWRNRHCIPRDSQMSCYQEQFPASYFVTNITLYWVVPVHFDATGSPVIVFAQDPPSSNIIRNGGNHLVSFPCIYVIGLFLNVPWKRTIVFGTS